MIHFLVLPHIVPLTQFLGNYLLLYIFFWHFNILRLSLSYKIIRSLISSLHSQMTLCLLLVAGLIINFCRSSPPTQQCKQIFKNHGRHKQPLFVYVFLCTQHNTRKNKMISNIQNKLLLNNIQYVLCSDSLHNVSSLHRWQD